MTARRQLAVAMSFVIATGACTKRDSRDAAGAASETPRVAIGAPAPAYRTIALGGDSVSLEQQRGKVVLLNVWATWCHPCRAEIPELQAIHAKYASRGLALVGVSVDNDGADDDIRAFTQEFKMSYPIWRDPDERVSAQFMLVGVPATFLIDRQGILRWRKTGPIAPGDTSLSAAIDRALGG
jgi:cytochrome c-type biogenesis protein